LSEILSAQQLLTFSLIWFAAAATPGGNVAFTVSVSSRYGFLTGIIGATGFVAALFFYMFLVSFGLGFAVAQYGSLLVVLKWAGILYLLYLAWRMWIAPTSNTPGKAFQAPNVGLIFVQGAAICLTNPKAILFIAVIFPQTVNAGQPLLPQLLALGSAGAMISLVVHSGYSALGHFLGQSVPSPAARRRVNRVIAAIFVVAAVGLALSNI
jgi:homoserine/homoserine lactone efflux protein